MFNKFSPLNLKQWIEENRHLLKPPVGNKVIWKDRDFIVMVVGGPNSRTDFHVNEGEEFFYQIEGNITVKVINDEGHIQDIHIRAGEIYLLPPKTPHSPQRSAGSIGLVIECRRRSEEVDGLQWYCQKCENKLYEEYFHLTNIETQFPPVFDRYYNSDYTNCKKCGFKNGRTWE